MSENEVNFEKLKEIIASNRASLDESKKSLINLIENLQAKQAEIIKKELSAAKSVDIVEENTQTVVEEQPVEEELIIEKPKEEPSKEELFIKEVEKEEKTESTPKTKPVKTKNNQSFEISSFSEDGRQGITNEILSNGEVRRVYIPPKEEKKPANVKVRVFDQGYNSKTKQRHEQKTGQTPDKPVNRAQTTTNVPQNFPPQKQNTEGKGKKNKYTGEEKSIKSERELIKKGYIQDTKHHYDYTNEDEDGYVRTKKVKQHSDQTHIEASRPSSCVITTEIVPIKVLCSKTGISAAEIIKKLFMLGIMKTINDNIDIDTAQLIASEFNITIEYKPEVTTEDTLSEIQENDDIDEIDKLKPRPPIITIMGHVDHGKTSLLDYIRKSHVASGEAGGITQAIGAYTIKLNGAPITFIDTPGHEAFTAMRARGSQVTDIAILVVSADDGIMPQTIESINHARNADVPIIVAINKIDKNGANPDRVLQQLTEYNLIPEEWGGDTQVCKVSAKTGEGIDSLLENILTLADVLELKANPERSASGTIIESRLDKGKGPIATILVQKGTLHTGDYVVAGVCYGKIKAMTDDKSKVVKSAGPSVPVSVSGFTEVPVAGDKMIVVTNEKFAKDLIEERKSKLNTDKESAAATSLADIFAKIKAGELKSLKLIVKADVQGSVEAVCNSLQQLGNEEVKIEIVHKAVGAITENDVNLASTANGIIIGFNVRPDTNAKSAADRTQVDIRLYTIIYDAIEDVKKAVKGMLAPKFEEVINGSAEVRQIFHITGAGVIAGSHVTTGSIQRGSNARLIRDGAIVLTTTIASLRHGKDDVKEIKEGWDCGISLQNFQDIKVGDIIESFTQKEIID